MKNNLNLSIGVLGLWHLGLVVSVCLAKSGYKVFGFDLDKRNVDKLNSAKSPVYEPNLNQQIKKYLNKNLYFSSDPRWAIKNKTYIFVTLDIPVNDNDEVDLSSLNTLFDLIVEYASKGTSVVILSQAPIGTTRALIKRLRRLKVIYFPENLRLGNAIKDFLNPSRIVLGSDGQEEVEQFLKDFPIFKCKILKMSVESAEMVKHALNSYLATCISFSSELSDLSEKSGANMLDVVKALKTDKRVSPFAPINPGLGFAGGTLGRDIQSLRKLARNKKYKSKLLNAVYSVNQDRLPMLISKIHSIYPSLKGKSIGILGLTYKPNTNTLRRSMSLELINKLKGKDCKIKAFDPAAEKNIKQFPFIKISTSIKSFFENLDMVILMTDWPEFKNIDPKTVGNLMNEKIIIDTKNFLDKQKYEKFGFVILRIGEGK